jgi:hypothetical protein
MSIQMTPPATRKSISIALPRVLCVPCVLCVKAIDLLFEKYSLRVLCVLSVKAAHA